MKVFISWSGELSKQLGAALRDWLPGTLQYVKPYFTPTDIEKGARWENEIRKELESSAVCIIALTRDSLESKWIMFEAGAISCKHDKARVCAILFDVEPTDVVGPLQPFQAAPFSKEEIGKLLKTINSNADEDRKLDLNVLDSVFEKWWPDLEKEIDQIMKASRQAQTPKLRSERNLLEEAVALGRNIQLEQRDLHETVYSIRALLSDIANPFRGAAGTGGVFIPQLPPGLSGGSMGKASGAATLSAIFGKVPEGSTGPVGPPNPKEEK